MRNTIITILIFQFFIFSCQSEPEDIYKTKSGEYASRKGNFVVKFPTEPTLQIIDNQIGLEKFQINLFRASFGKQQVYSIEFTDFPEHLLKSWDTKQYYDQTIKTIEAQYDGVFIISQQKEITQNNLKGREFVLSLNDNSPKAKNKKGYVEGRIYKINNRVYSIMYYGEDNSKVESFMNSFRLLKK
jgi:hypothetical protein